MGRRLCALSPRTRRAAPARRLPAAEVQARALRPGRAGEAAAADGARTGAFLGGLFTHVCGAGAAALIASPWLAATAARLVGDYAAWLGGPGAGAHALPRLRGHAQGSRICIRRGFHAHSEIPLRRALDVLVCGKSFARVLSVSTARLCNYSQSA